LSQLPLVATLLAWAAAAAADSPGCEFNSTSLPSSAKPPPHLLLLTSSASTDSAASTSLQAPLGGLLSYGCPGFTERRYAVCLPGFGWHPDVSCPKSPAPIPDELPWGVCRVPGVPAPAEADLAPVWSNLTASPGQSVYVDCIGADSVLLGPARWTCLPGAADPSGSSTAAAATDKPAPAVGRWDRNSLPRCVRQSVRCWRPAAATAERCLNPACNFYFADSVAVFTCGGRQTAHLCQANGTWYPGTESLCATAPPTVGQAGSPNLMTTLAWVLGPCAVLALLLLAVALALLALRRARFLRRRRARHNAAAAAIVAAAGGSTASLGPLPPPLTPSAGSRDAAYFDEFDYFSYASGGYYYDDFGAIDLLLDSSSGGRRSFPRASSSAAYDDDGVGGGDGSGGAGGGDLVRLLSAARPPSYDEAVAADNPAALSGVGSAVRGGRGTAAPTASASAAAGAAPALQAGNPASRSLSGAQSRRRPRPLQSTGPLGGGGLCDGDTLSTSTAVSLPAPAVSIAGGAASPQQQQQQQSQCRSSLETMAFSDGTSVTLPTLESTSSRSLASNRPLCGSVGKPADCADGAA
ncbi:hypothetical protein BOX15_Mlig030270g1, partial [Macrostomum lignano]